MSAVSSPESDQPDHITIAFALGHGPHLTPLRGKVPVLGAWQSLPAATLDTVLDWHECGYNLGFRTGRASGLVVIDDDQARHGAAGYVPPTTGLVAESPTGGRHYYYRSPSTCPGNSASRLAPYVDVRGEGGQVVYPGSIHPVALRPYIWVSTGEPSELPAETLAVLRGPTVHVDTTRPTPSVPLTGRGYAETALLQEVGRVRTAPGGARNDALNRAAFNLGQLVAGDALSDQRVRDELYGAAKLVGDGEAGEDDHIRSTIRSGLAAGALKPRRVPERPGSGRSSSATAPATSTAPATERPDILVPGSHLLAGGEYVEQGTDTFARAVLGAISPEALYRRAQRIGRIADGQFRVLGPDRLRSILDEAVRLTAVKPAKTEDDEPAVIFRTCTLDLARIVAAYAETDGDVRDLDHLATYPVCSGPEYLPARAGWNADARLYLACSAAPKPLDLPTSRAVLEDLVADFPFATPADRTNFFGLLLTPILRPALREPVPMHLIGSPIERIGKTKLAEIVLGCSILGRPTPAMQLGVREEEREKRITALLLSGASIVHLDNLERFMDSPALASLLTSTVYQGRELNHSRVLSLPNGLTVVGTGNNVSATGEISKRIVPIMLQSPLESPESRQDFRHPDIRGHVENDRERILGALLGLIQAWRLAGRPTSRRAFGGFERWTAVTGGVLDVAGYPDHLANLTAWRGGSDEFSVELQAFVAAWQAKYAREWAPTSGLFELAGEEELFDRQLGDRTKRGKQTAFGMNVLNVIDGRVVAGYRIAIAGQGKRRRARLVDPTEDTKD